MNKDGFELLPRSTVDFICSDPEFWKWEWAKAAYEDVCIWGGNVKVLWKEFSKVYLNFHDMFSCLVIADSKLLNI